MCKEKKKENNSNNYRVTVWDCYRKSYQGIKDMVNIRKINSMIRVAQRKLVKKIRKNSI